eukprot:1154670-Pelagomonas_calceolata.AAC.1
MQTSRASLIGGNAAGIASKREAKAAAGLILREELRARQRVLRRLGYVTSEGVVTLKGRGVRFCGLRESDTLAGRVRRLLFLPVRVL